MAVGDSEGVVTVIELCDSLNVLQPKEKEVITEVAKNKLRCLIEKPEKKRIWKLLENKWKDKNLLKKIIIRKMIKKLNKCSKK